MAKIVEKDVSAGAKETGIKKGMELLKQWGLLYKIDESLKPENQGIPQFLTQEEMQKVPLLAGAQRAYLVFTESKHVKLIRAEEGRKPMAITLLDYSNPFNDDARPIKGNAVDAFEQHANEMRALNKQYKSAGGALVAEPNKQKIKALEDLKDVMKVRKSWEEVSDDFATPIPGQKISADAQLELTGTDQMRTQLDRWKGLSPARRSDFLQWYRELEKPEQKPEFLRFLREQASTQSLLEFLNTMESKQVLEKFKRQTKQKKE